MPNWTIHSLDEHLRRYSSIGLGRRVSFLALAGSSELVGVGNAGLFKIDQSKGVVGSMATFGIQPPMRTTDGACDPAGRLFFGVAGPPSSDRMGLLYRLGRDGTLVVVRDSVRSPNGLAWDVEGINAYQSDTHNRRVDKLLFDPAGEIVATEPFAEMDGMPDGLAVDSEGGVWVALWDRSSVRRYSLYGELEEEIRFPVDHVTSCAFGGLNHSTLFVTSAKGRQGTIRSKPGGVLSVEVGIVGTTVWPMILAN